MGNVKILRMGLVKTESLYYKYEKIENQCRLVEWDKGDLCWTLMIGGTVGMVG